MQYKIEEQKKIIFTALLCVLALFANSQKNSEDRPNIIIIMTDDMGKETVGAHGGLDYKTPNLDRLASEGMKFENCFAQPLCTPSRVKIMTGKYNFRNYEKFGLLPKTEVTFGNVLQEAGYNTCIVGKWQLGGKHQDILNFGWDEYCLNNGVKPQNPKDKPYRKGKERYWENKNVVANGEYYKTSERYGPDMMNEYARNFISKKRKKPFFLYYPMMLPHNPWAPTPFSNDGDKSGEKVSEVRYFKDNIEYIDHLVGNIIKTLEKTGQRDNTIIMFTGDNGTGYAVPVTAPSTTIKRVISVTGSRHDEVVRLPGEQSVLLKRKKKDVYVEGPITKATYGDIPGRKDDMRRDGTNVPMIVDWAKYRSIYNQKGHSYEDLIDFSDFFATVIDAAGVKTDSEIDGISFLPRLKGEAVNSRDFVFCHYWFFGRDPKKAKDAIHNAHYKLYSDGSFYNVKEDPNEEHKLNVNQLTTKEEKAYQHLKKSYSKVRGTTIPVKKV
ncbi:sulfatase-like hydrolase/transferase [Tamlana sp. 2201CG12-4]|uniref:sulfatase-like hydrolase/transferase n=1 Tax=Tamlana sp. 2201CG12-4 TaxID=3112582 RepID=UPI002DBC8ECB|nr:sulfatase-like hydrolase/transferase [Tamlana sp. 2201CG12-4]MEC3905714.1 sulfatase-like hydrolase/transferase [Tamlana sp. 2201CG12-4]